jgi:hypothetical protein
VLWGEEGREGERERMNKKKDESIYTEGRLNFKCLEYPLSAISQVKSMDAFCETRLKISWHCFAAMMLSNFYLGAPNLCILKCASFICDSSL